MNASSHTLSQDAYDDAVDLLVQCIKNGTPISFGELIDCCDDPDGESAVAVLVALDLHWDIPETRVITIDDLRAGLEVLGTTYEREMKRQELQMVIDACECGVSAAETAAEERHFTRQLLKARSSLESVKKGA